MTVSDTNGKDAAVDPVAGLKVLTKPEWNVDIPERNYRVSVSIIGDRILKAAINGYSTHRESRATADLFNRVIAEHLDPEQGFVQIFDMKYSSGFSSASKKNYQAEAKRRKGVLGHIFYNTSMMFNITLKLGRKTNRSGFGVHIVNNYKEAINLAEKLISEKIPSSSDIQVDTVTRAFNGFDSNGYCPVSHLTIRTKPEWTNVKLGEEYTATFKIIGNSILLSEPFGQSGYDGIERFMDLRAKVIESAFGSEAVFAEIKDYSQAKIPYRSTRGLFYSRMKQDEKRIAAFIGFKAPMMIEFSFNVGKRIVKLNFPIEIVPNYAKAITMAVEAINAAREARKIPPPAFFSSKIHRGAKTYTSSQINQYVDEMVSYLGNISWEIDGIDSSVEHIPSSHPFGLVFEAFSLIKSDLDILSKERRNAEAETLKSQDDLKKTQKQLIQAEKMAALGSLVAGVSHEISTPLGIGVTASSFLLNKTREFEQKKASGPLSETDMDRYLHVAMESASMIFDNLNKAAELIKSFKQVSVDQSHELKRPYNLKSYTQSILQSLGPRFKRTSYVTNLHCDEKIMVDSYPGALSQIITNLVLNSLIHGFENRDDGAITLRMWETHAHIHIEFTDNGHGMDQATVRKVFDPFFTTKRAAGGTGLGLHIVYNIVTGKLKGDISCTSSPGEGATFLILFPH